MIIPEKNNFISFILPSARLYNVFLINTEYLYVCISYMCINVYVSISYKYALSWDKKFESLFNPFGLRSK